MEDLIARVILFLVMAGAGVALIWVASAGASGRLKRNQLAGIRTPSTLASDEAWLAAHVRAKRPTLVTGGLSIAIALSTFLPVPTEALTLGVLGGGILMLFDALGRPRGRQSGGQGQPHDARLSGRRRKRPYRHGCCGVIPRHVRHATAAVTAG